MTDITKLLFLMIIILALITLVIVNLQDNSNVFPSWLVKPPFNMLIAITLFIIMVYSVISIR